MNLVAVCQSVRDIQFFQFREMARAKEPNHMKVSRCCQSLAVDKNSSLTAWICNRFRFTFNMQSDVENVRMKVIVLSHLHLYS